MLQASRIVADKKIQELHAAQYFILLGSMVEKLIKLNIHLQSNTLNTSLSYTALLKREK